MIIYSFQIEKKINSHFFKKVLMFSNKNYLILLKVNHKIVIYLKILNILDNVN